MFTTVVLWFLGALYFASACFWFHICISIAAEIFYFCKSRRWKRFYRQLSSRNRLRYTDFVTISRGMASTRKKSILVSIWIMPQYLAWRMIPLVLFCLLLPVPLLLFFMLNRVAVAQDFLEWLDNSIYRTIYRITGIPLPEQ